MMLGAWFQRLGVAIAVAIVSAVAETLQGATFEEFGMWAAVAGAVAGILVGVLGKLGRWLQDRLPGV
jgi:uncharacterized membrane protein